MGLFLKLLDTLYGDTMAVLKSCEIDYDCPPEQAVAIVTAGDVPLGSEENILCITGGEGTGKSNYTAALVAGAIMEREEDADLLGVKVEPNRKGRAVLLYDTEQSEQQLYKNTGRLLRRAGREKMPPYLHVYCLTGMSRNERLTAIIQSMDKYHYLHGGIHLVVIDGVADLIRCANDEAESVALVDEIYRLAGIYRTCITAVVHFVPNGLKLRGHLGSELQRTSANGRKNHPAFGCVAEKTAAPQRTLTRNERPDGVFFVCKNLEVTPMNNTIPFHSATHAPQITVDVNILTMLKQAASCLTEAAGKDMYLAAIGPDMELTIIMEEDAPSVLPCFDEDDALISVKGAPLFISYNPAQVLKLAGKRYLTGPVIFYRTDGHSTIVSLTVEDIYRFQTYLESHSTTLMADGQKLTCICID